MATTRCRRALAAATTVFGGIVLAGAAVTGTAAAAGANPIIIQPNPVAPGGTISVFDGGNCDVPATGTATFQANGGVGIPSISMSVLQNMIGGQGQIPANVPPGAYQVSVTCVTSDGKTEGPFTGTLNVQSGASTGVNPNGGAKTGDGASLTTPGGLAEGVALVVAGGGAWLLLLLRRRRFGS